jgi:hypothetical protein
MRLDGSNYLHRRGWINTSASSHLTVEAESSVTSVNDEKTKKWIHGTFILSHCTVEYALYRLSDEEFQEKKARALWSLVRKLAKYWFRRQHLTWEGIRDRRDKRRTYLELWASMNSNFTLDDPVDEGRWAELIRSLHPNDLYLA